jgi:YopX protein
MNRQLKFRIWDKQTKKWLENSNSLHCYSNWTICPFTGNLVDYVGVIDGDNNDTFTSSPANDYYFDKKRVLIKEPRYVIQQYTGLKDSKGIEIYEGDICNAGMVIGPIEFIIGSFSLASNPLIEFMSKDTCVFSPDFDPSWIDVEVVGNVCENPDFFKNK